MYNATQLKKRIPKKKILLISLPILSLARVYFIEYFLINDLHLNSAQEAQRRALLRLESSSLQLSR